MTQVQDNATWSQGKQTIPLGGEWDYQNSPNVFLPAAAGAFDFAPGSTSTPFRNTASNSALNNGLTGMAEGISETLMAAGNVTSHFTEPDVAFYFQDDWKLLHNLTLNLGMRYEYFGQSVNLAAQRDGSAADGTASVLEHESSSVGDHLSQGRVLITRMLSRALAWPTAPTSRTKAR